MDIATSIPNGTASSTSNNPAFTAAAPSRCSFTPSPPDASTLSLYAPPAHLPDPSHTPKSAYSPDPSHLPTPPIPSPQLNHTPSRSRRHPLRRATTTAQYNLSAKWSSLSGYLTSSSSGSSDDTSTSTHETLTARQRRIGNEMGSEKESGSDEYVSRAVGGKRGLKRREGERGKKREGGKGGRVGRAGKRRRGERLEKADMEVIWGEKEKVRKGKGLGGLTRGEAGRLVEFVLAKMDWGDAAGYVCVGRALKVQGREGGLEGLAVEGKEAARISSPEGLKAHWRDMLGNKLVDLYRD
ncbi:hypothetical protein MMC30_004746 [Trapelia coarctata]|nr:hypothetical protein [Trapelia coarctata]